MGNMREPVETPPSEDAIASILPQSIHVPGMQLCVLDRDPKKHIDDGIDGMLQVSWHGQEERYAYEYKTSSTPQAIVHAVMQIQRWAGSKNLQPLVIVPYLSETRLNELDAQGISGLDLCGNCVLTGSAFYIWRSGNPNKYTESRPIKNVFRGNSSIFCRCFVLQSSFPSLTALRDFARARAISWSDEGSLTLATASKVVRTLEQQLLVQRSDKNLRTLDRGRLLDALLKEYRLPTGRRIRGKAKHLDWLFDEKNPGKVPSRAVMTGQSAASYYGVLSTSDVMSVYVPDVQAVAAAIHLEETRVFPTVELIEDRSEVPYFDVRRAKNRLWASPVQTWLELASGDPRERTAADLLRRTLTDGTLDTHER